MKRSKQYPVYSSLAKGTGGGGADVSGVTATAGDVDTGKVFVDSTGAEITGQSTYKADYTTLNTLVGQTTAAAEDVAQGKVFVNSSGVQTTGTASGGGGSDEDFIKMVERAGTQYFHPTITIPSGATKIGMYVFKSYSKLGGIVIPNTVTIIENEAFYECSSLQLSSIPNSITSIGANAFYGCKKISISSLPSGLDVLGSSAFQNCTDITEILFLSTPTTLANSAFYRCTNLTTIRVPWSEGAVAYAPWGATNATIVYDYTPQV